MKLIGFLDTFPRMKLGPHRWAIWTRYNNSNGFAFAIVAVGQFCEDDDEPTEMEELIDWTAYWGGCGLVQRERDAVAWIAEYANAMPSADAHYFFPHLPTGKYRD